MGVWAFLLNAQGLLVGGDRTVKESRGVCESGV